MLRCKTTTLWCSFDFKLEVWQGGQVAEVFHFSLAGTGHALLHEHAVDPEQFMSHKKFIRQCRNQQKTIRTGVVRPCCSCLALLRQLQLRFPQLLPQGQIWKTYFARYQIDAFELGKDWGFLWPLRMESGYKICRKKTARSWRWVYCQGISRTARALQPLAVQVVRNKIGSPQDLKFCTILQDFKN